MTFLFLCAAAFCLSGLKFSVWNPAVFEVMIIINVFHEGQMSNMTSTSSFCGSDYVKDTYYDTHGATSMPSTIYNIFKCY